VLLRYFTVRATPGEAARHGLPITTAQIRCANRSRHPDALHAQRVKAEQRIRLAQAVLVQVAPEPDAGKVGVGCVKLRIAKQLAPVVNASVAIEVAY